MALEKPPRGKPVREREILLFLQDKKSDIHFYSQKSNLSQPRNLTSRLSWFPCFCCLDFCANLLGKRAKNISKSQPRFLCRRRKIRPRFSCPEQQKKRTVRTSLNDAVLLENCAWKVQKTALKFVPVIHLENYAEKVQSVQTVRTSISVLYGLEIRAGYGL